MDYKKQGFTTEEYRARINRIVAYINAEGIDGYMISDPYNAFYLGLYYHPGKRPVIFFVHKSGKVYAFTPAMEYHEACKLAHLNKVYPYDDNYNKKADVYTFMHEVIQSDFPDTKEIYVDSIGIDKYQALCEMFSTVTIHDQIAVLRQIKSPEEIQMLRLSAYYSDLMVKIAKTYMKVGATELGILNRAITDTVDQMIDDGLRVVYVPGGPAGALIPSGPNTAIPHSLPCERALIAGDNMILSCGSNVWGYRTESERTVFLGEPKKEMLEPYQVMCAAQELGIKLMKPGAVCEEVEFAVLKFITDAGYGKYVRHRTGHGKGLEEHEDPYVAAGDRIVMQEGMIFSSEPGIYIEGLAGFRHSDTVLITKTGSEAITKFPKDLNNTVIPL